MKLTRIAVVLAAMGLSASAFATNGYFAHGYGMKSKGMAGAAMAVTGDTFGGANNPASMVWAGNRVDFGLDWFSPKRSASRQGSATPVPPFPAGTPGGLYDGTSESGSNNFFIPEFGFSKMLRSDMAVGVTVYGNGGMNTDYSPGVAGGAMAPAFAPSCAGAPSNILFGCGKLGVDLAQLVIAPTFSLKLNNDHSFGVSPLIGYQRFKVDGLQAFDELGFTSSPGNTTNKGYDSAHGFGVRIGWLGKVSDTVTLGAAYSSKIRMSKFDKYKGLFAEQGDFDIPENYGAGISVKATPGLTMAFDIQQINYGKVRSVANTITNSLVNPVANGLGTENGSGFHWRDQTVFKLGAEYEYDKNLILRAGFNYGKSPVRGDNMDDVSFNILAPGVVEKHLTLGATWTLANKAELTLSYMHAFEKSVTGPSATALLGVGGTETLKMREDSLGIAYGWKM